MVSPSTGVVGTDGLTGAPLVIGEWFVSVSVWLRKLYCLRLAGDAISYSHKLMYILDTAILLRYRVWSVRLLPYETVMHKLNLFVETESRHYLLLYVIMVPRRLK